MSRRSSRRGAHTLKEAQDAFLRVFVAKALERNRVGGHWNKSGTARDLGIDRMRLQRLIDRLGLAADKSRTRLRRSRDHR